MCKYFVLCNMKSVQEAIVENSLTYKLTLMQGSFSKTFTCFMKLKAACSLIEISPIQHNKLFQ
jgi:hypothetical protein